MGLHFRLVTPERVLMDQDVVSVSLPTMDGEITVLQNHAPLAATLVAGIARVRKADGTEEDVAVSDGVIHVDEKGVISVLAQTAEHGRELDLSVIEEARQRAMKLMTQAASQDDVAFAAAAAGLERELARYRLATKHRRGHGTTLPSSR